MIEDPKEKAPEEKKKIPHWIIRNRKGNSIWNKSFSSYQEAKAEFDFSELKDDEWFITSN